MRTFCTYVCSGARENRSRYVIRRGVTDTRDRQCESGLAGRISGVCVQYVDYGNEAVVAHKHCLWVVDDAQLRETPALAITCRLDGWAPARRVVNEATAQLEVVWSTGDSNYILVSASPFPPSSSSSSFLTYARSPSSAPEMFDLNEKKIF